MIVMAGFFFKGKAQDTLFYDIKTALIYVGELQVVQQTSADSSSYKLLARVNFLRKYHIDYVLESTFKENILLHSLAYIRVNQRYYHFCRVTLKNKMYEINRPEATNESYSQPISSGISRLYFDDSIIGDSLFSEYAGIYKPFVKKVMDTYVLVDNSQPLEFVFANGHVVKVIVPNNIMDFVIVLRP